MIQAVSLLRQPVRFFGASTE